MDMGKKGVRYYTIHFGWRGVFAIVFLMFKQKKTQMRTRGGRENWVRCIKCTEKVQSCALPLLTWCIASHGGGVHLKEFGYAFWGKKLE